ncbi:MAG: CCA tRNA nucleotidyltransferase [Alphaproteobacteria bacterium]|nr:CCA tRNA nucleotidyltransferase [Alphaproteobacteria bacterium]
MKPVTHIDPQPWMMAPESVAVMAALHAGETPDSDALVALFVGGCVRDSLLGRPVGDIDIATVLAPEEVSNRLQAADLKVVPTGLAHGTVTAVAEGKPFEITTLRVDVRTDGRRATVSFTNDWAADAARRDFTVNALFADSAGAIFDPVGGLADIKARRIRFVGDAEQRIREDVLRLLRFFRFYAQFGAAPPDRDAIAACAKLADLLPTLSNERVATELFKLLAAPDPATTMTLMSANGVLRHFLPEAQEIDRLAALVTVDGIVDHADPLRRLAAGLKIDATGADAIADRLRLSNADRARLAKLVESAGRFNRDMSDPARRATLYRLGADLWRDRVLIDWAEEIALGTPQNRHTTDGWRELYELPEEWTAPVFPVQGNDVLALGVPAGPAVGRYLAQIEAWWIDGGFVANRAACLDRLSEVIGKD